jgi:light-regulated signal transduction histidine kinase (bacteriophytochrome)
MNSLLKRQLKKYLTEEQLPALELLLAAINESYTTYEDHIAMLQRAIKLSSDELYEANQKLRDEATSLKEINKNLEFILNSMNLSNNPDGPNQFNAIEHIQQQSAEIIRINAQREELLKNLELQNQSLNEYAHVVSHDLKAPLRSINALINWVIEDNNGKLDEGSVRSLNLILFNVEKMDLLIKGILDYSSIDKLESENRVVDFNAMVDEISRTIVLQRSVEIKIEGTLPNMYGNFFRFRQLFQNLIENSIKYNDKEKGFIEIGCSIKDNAQIFFVKDNGRGIPTAYFDKIFNVFTKLDSKDQSSGIGLSIVKKIINFYGGKIWVESVEGKETTFYFTLPSAVLS